MRGIISQGQKKRETSQSELKTHPEGRASALPGERDGERVEADGLAVDERPRDGDAAGGTLDDAEGLVA